MVACADATVSLSIITRIVAPAGSAGADVNGAPLLAEASRFLCFLPVQQITRQDDIQGHLFMCKSGYQSARSRLFLCGEPPLLASVISHFVLFSVFLCAGL